MGHNKGFLWYVVYCWEILRFVSDSFFFLPHSLVISFLFVEAVRELRTERKKTRIPLDLNFIFEVYGFCGENVFLNQ